jgi:uncharacterized protein (TIGR02996 family)
MDEREALIQTVIDNPDDDTPRLVYADRQEEHSDAAHAELIRAQCELARLPARSKKRAAELLERPENAALAEFGNGFERGMVRCARWFADDPFDFDGVPLERVLLLDVASFGDSNWPDVAAAPWAVRIPRVELHEYGGSRAGGARAGRVAAPPEPARGAVLGLDHRTRRARRFAPRPVRSRHRRARSSGQHRDVGRVGRGAGPRARGPARGAAPALGITGVQYSDRSRQRAPDRPRP